MRRYAWPVVGLLTVLTYNSWAFWEVNGRARIFDGYLSEFSASNQPYSFFFRGGDLTTALLVLALVWRAVTWHRLRQASSRWEVVAWLGLLLFAVSTGLDAFFSMDCSPTLSEACRVAEETGRLSLIHYAHTYTSVGAQTGIVVSMVAAYLALLLAPPRPGRGRHVRRVVLALALVEVVALLIMMVLLVAGLPGLGYPQVVMVLVASLWFAVVGFDLVQPPPPASAGTPPRPLERPVAR
ncbi:DUF998 domain-containing protein [uncultured Friedmanniella sp.]|uniref:DUF998 domain-containing protein n=1 Tax=uncultured Friedmanniella sp. TaxID=335381 RepID=UPI0035CCA419